MYDIICQEEFFERMVITMRAATQGGCKEAIIEAAEELFAQHGFAATSLRQITAEAGSNLASVNYHFGTKAALITVILQRMLGPLAEARMRNFTRITESGKVPSLEELLWAYYEPFFEMLDSSQQEGHRRRQIFGRLANEPDEEIRKSITSIAGAATEKYFHAFRQAVPDLPDDEFVWRFKMMHGIVTVHFAEAVLPATDAIASAIQPTKAEPASEARSRTWLMASLLTAWRAPATQTEERHGK